MRQGTCERCGQKECWINHKDDACSMHGKVGCEVCADCFDELGWLPPRPRTGGRPGRRAVEDLSFHDIVRAYEENR